MKGQLCDDKRKQRGELQPNSTCRFPLVFQIKLNRNGRRKKITVFSPIGRKPPRHAGWLRWRAIPAGYRRNKQTRSFRNNSWVCFSNGEAPSAPVTPRSSAAGGHASHVLAPALCPGAAFPPPRTHHFNQGVTMRTSWHVEVHF